jgi:hypothetical protein
MHMATSPARHDTQCWHVTTVQACVTQQARLWHLGSSDFTTTAAQSAQRALQHKECSRALQHKERSRALQHKALILHLKGIKLSISPTQ